MINKTKIIEYLNNNDLNDIEELKYNEDTFVIRLYYDFDEDELKSARAYADDECDEESESDSWYEEYYLPYLNDLAVDNVGEIMEDAMNDLSLEAQYVAYEADKENQDYCEFVVVFYEQGAQVEIETILDELNI